MSDKRPGILKLHAILAGFFLPVAVMFILTGALYTWGQKGSYDTTTESIELTTALDASDKAAMHALVVQLLEERSLSQPSGGFKVKKAGTSFYFEWTGSNRDVVLQPTETRLEAKLQIKETTLHRRLVQLHKAKGGVAFKVFATLLSAGLLVLFASGFVLALKHPQVKRAAWIGVAAGFLAFVVFVVLA